MDTYIEALEDSALEKEKRGLLIVEIKSLCNSSSINDSEVRKDKLDEPLSNHEVKRIHPVFKSLSADVEINYSPSRGRFAVAKR